MRYSEVRKRSVGVRRPTSDVEAELDADALAEIPKLLRAILGASKNIKLYPLGSKPVSTSIGQLHEALAKILSGRPSVSFASLDSHRTRSTNGF